MKKLPLFAPVVLRLGLAGVFIWFGLSQLISPTMWVSYIPSWAVNLSGFAPTTLVVFNGLFEVVMAVLLAFGILNRIVAGLLFLHMVAIVGDVGLSPVGVRDIGLAVGLLASTMFGEDILSWKSAIITPVNQ